MNKLWRRSKKTDQFFEERGKQYVPKINEDSLLKSLTFRKPAKVPQTAQNGFFDLGGMKSSSDSTFAPTMSYQSQTGSTFNSSSSQSVVSSRSRRMMDDEVSHRSGSSFDGPKDISIHSPLQQIIENMKISVFPKESRLASVADALLELDHKDRGQHDIELQSGAANVLFQKLAFAVLTTPYHTFTRNNLVDSSSQSYVANAQKYSDADHEIAMISAALEMVYRASDAAIKRSYEDIGEEILPLLIQVINRPFQNNYNFANPQHMMSGNSDPSTIISKDQKLAVQKITKVLASFSLIPSAKYEMAHAPNLLPSLVNIIDTSGSDRMRSNEMGQTGGANGIRSNTAGAGLLMTEATRFNAIAIITNLAHADGNKMYMLSIPGLAQNVCKVASSDPNDVARRCASLAIMNLSNGDDSHVPDMNGNEFVLETLHGLIKDEQPDTRRNAAISLYNLACSDVNTDLMARHGDGMIVEALVEVVSGTTEHSALWNDKIRSNAAETLFNMSCSKNKLTTVRMANHPSLLEGLSSALKSSLSTLDVKMFCAATIRRLAEVIEHPMLCLGALFTALVKGQTWTKTDDIAQGFMVQAMNVEHRKMMVFHHGLLSALGNMAMMQGDENAKIRDGAIATVGMLSSEPEARQVMAKHEGIMMALTKASYRLRLDPGGSESNEESDDLLDATTSELVKEALKNLVAEM